MILNDNDRKIYLCSIKFNRAERVKISISPMLAHRERHSLAYYCTELITAVKSFMIKASGYLSINAPIVKAVFTLAMFSTISHTIRPTISCLIQLPWQIEMILSVLHHPRWPRQVKCLLLP